MSEGIAQNRADFARLISLAQTSGHGHLVELLRPAMRGQLNVSLPRRDTRMPPLHTMGKRGRPVLVLLGDDDYQPTGPKGWACSDKLRSWARFALVHAAGAEPAHYARAASLAIECGRLLLIETASSAADDWALFLSARSPAIPLLGILPTGGQHPIRPDAGAVH